MTRPTPASFVGHRGELMAELFLQRLGEALVFKSSVDFGLDFLLALGNGHGGFDFVAVQVKATEQAVAERFPLKREVRCTLSSSNIPGLLLVVNVKLNRIYCWLSDPPSSKEPGRRTVPLLEVKDDADFRHLLREHIARWSLTE